ncbi:MAG TPA: ATP-binding protein, partial [Candidatus Angelobacter sp.]|nr:ATP-binding protein [Candidatus Angelobacter sp.]
MNMVISTLLLRNERDVVQARQRARELAAMLGFDNQGQIRLATATSEMARNAFRYAREGKVNFGVSMQEPQTFQIEISDRGPGIRNLSEIMEGRYRSETGMGVGIVGTKRLMDAFSIESSPGGTVVRLGKGLPQHRGQLTEKNIKEIAAEIKTRAPEGPYEELERQNQELLKTLQELRARQEDLALLNRELEDTNRGVVALYAELDERADYLRRASEMKTNFLSNISHEFRTPVNSIISLSRILLDRLDGELTSEQEKQVTFISRAARSLSEMVNDLLDLAKVEAGKVKIRIKTFDVSELFSALKGMLKPLLADNTSVELVFSEELEVSSLHTDEGKVSQILRNFISNAIKFTPQGEVSVSALERGGEIIFVVRDTGIGIDPKDQETIFQEFAQIDNPLQEKFFGTGLGLPLCRNLAALLGGKVWVESELGRGSTFYASIPRIYRGQGDLQVETEELAVQEFHRAPVLLVHAYPEVFNGLEPHFRRSEFQLVQTRTLSGAMEWLDRHVPEAVIYDAQQDPVLQGLLLESIQAKRAESKREIAVIRMSGDQYSVSADAATGETNHLKPLDGGILHELRRVTGRERPLKLLLVDDNDISRYILRELLDRPWLSLIEAHNGREAIEMALQENPDGIILDLVMPERTGFEVLEKLRMQEKTRNLPVIVCTSKPLSTQEK